MSSLTLEFDELESERGQWVGGVIRFMARIFIVLLLAVARGHAQTIPAGRKTITLEELQQMALQNNPTLAQGAASIRAAEGRKKQSGLYPNPTVGYQGEQIRGGSFRGGEQGFFVQQDIVTAGKLGLSQNVFEQKKKQAEAGAREQKLRVMTSVKICYIHALAAQQMLELRQDLSKLAQDVVETSHQLANVGQADAPDVLEAEVEGQQAKLDVTMAEQNQQRVWHELAAVAGNPRLSLMPLEGNLKDTPAMDAPLGNDLGDDPVDDLVEKIVSESPSVKIAELEVAKAEAVLARAKRESIPDLQLRGGLEDNRELLDTTGQPVGLQGFADVGVRIPIFNHNQGNVAASNADIERARREVERVKLVLRARAASVAQNYAYSRDAVARYKNEMIPRAQKAYEMVATQYQAMAAAYPQVLIAQRTLMQLRVAYVGALESFATNSAALQSYLLTDGLEAPSEVGAIEQPVGEMSVRMQPGSGPEGR